MRNVPSQLHSLFPEFLHNYTFFFQRMGQAPSQQYHHSRTDPLGILSSQEENDFLNEVKITRSQGLTNFEGSRLHKLLREDPSLVLSQGMQHMSISIPASNEPETRTSLRRFNISRQRVERPYGCSVRKSSIIWTRYGCEMQP